MRSGIVSGRYFLSLILVAVIATPGMSQGQQRRRMRRPDPGKLYTLNNSEMNCTVSRYGITSMTDPSDTSHADIVGFMPFAVSKLTYSETGSSWINFLEDTTRSVSSTGSAVTVLSKGKDGMTMKQVFSLSGKELDMEIEISAPGDRKITIGDLAIGLPWKRPSGEDPNYIFEQCFTKHHYISGNGSFLYFTKPSGDGPFFMVLPMKGTKLEYFDDTNREYNAYIYSKCTGDTTPGNWRLEHTAAELGGAGRQPLKAGFRFLWADSWDDMRETLYNEGLFDIRVVPGMTIPSDLKATFSLHTKNRIDSITPEFPGKTTVKYLGEKQPGYHLYQVSFAKLGENMLTIHYGNGEETYLEFFSTEPIETLIKKRASFLVNSHQHRDPTKWYNGLFSVYDMKNSVLRGPDNTDGFDGWWGYVLACDDPGLSKAPFLASKNVYYPNDKEIAALEYYIENIVWDKLQRTDKDDPFPYGIYGVPNWKEAREWKPEKPDSLGRELLHVWRSYDYPHIAMLYYHMYQIAKMYPEKVKYLDADGYLERAFQTAKAFFLYPYEILPYYDTYKWGCYNELVFENIINDLEESGRKDDADWLRNEYEKKVKYFVYDDKYPFRSEYAIDRTAFESSYALAKYGTLNEIPTDTLSWFDKNKKIWRSHPVVRKSDAREFMDRQNSAALAVRGWLETKYFLLGGDFTASSDNHCLSYMAMMGGRSILDYGVNFAPNPYDWLQLGYASYLSSWSLMNTGTEESNYGYWFPGKQNDGAVGWAFMESQRGRAWIRKDMDRGAWYYDGEIDLGLGAATRTARSVLTNDPLFGWIAYGGDLSESKEGFIVKPKDGIRNRFALVSPQSRIQFELDRDGMSSAKGINVTRDLKEVGFTIENRYGKSHQTRITIESNGDKEPGLRLDGKKVDLKRRSDGLYYADLEIRNDLQKVLIKL